ncbi:ABC transporter ATP-binding protein [Psychromonas sp. Urea-02u-13]|uniref:ABC transporter ATP-binding protein n=1 Tax=Psychromonas sp. Urea-02u-13 TaxID=2058326 RepID=UPI000C31FD02|nr:ABC transporter ATP-binding protein [Psychromonas sp. Urea-02u-13]PKG40457.1 ABC transporter ATP-binding protein [Psychromonas sp. Urea-02u-13]
MSKISLRNINKKYPNADHCSVQDFNLDIEEGEFIVLVGPSGCGKSTTLRMIAGLEDITEGEFILDGEVVNNVSSKDRDIAMVFQSYALYPHMSVRENIGYGLKLRNYPAQTTKKQVDAISKDLFLTQYLERKPKELSGGQRQRVALGRAMVRTPKLYLMDEPLSNLDAKLRTTTRTEISRMHRAKGAITVYVTHDQVEAMTMADRIVLMSMGEVQQIGSPKELFTNPKNCFVATFIGMPSMNLIEGTYKDGQFSCPAFTILVCDSDRIILDGAGYDGKLIFLGARSSSIRSGKKYEQAFPDSCFETTAKNVEYLGDSVNVFFDAAPMNMFVGTLGTGEREVEIDEKITLVIDNTKLHFFDSETEESIKFNVKAAK